MVFGQGVILWTQQLYLTLGIHAKLRRNQHYGWNTHNWLVVSTHLINISQNGNLPQIRVKIKNIWNHHLDEGRPLPLLELDFHSAQSGFTILRPHLFPNKAMGWTVDSFHLSTFKCPCPIFNKQIVCKVNIRVFMYSKNILYWLISSKYVYI